MTFPTDSRDRCSGSRAWFLLVLNSSPLLWAVGRATNSTHPNVVLYHVLSGACCLHSNRRVHRTVSGQRTDSHHWQTHRFHDRYVLGSGLDASSYSIRELHGQCLERGIASTPSWNTHNNGKINPQTCEKNSQRHIKMTKFNQCCKNNANQQTCCKRVVCSFPVASANGWIHHHHHQWCKVTKEERVR